MWWLLLLLVLLWWRMVHRHSRLLHEWGWPKCPHWHTYDITWWTFHFQVIGTFRAKPSEMSQIRELMGAIAGTNFRRCTRLFQ